MVTAGFYEGLSGVIEDYGYQYKCMFGPKVYYYIRTQDLRLSRISEDDLTLEELLE